MNPVHELLRSSTEPSIRYLYQRDVLGKNPLTPELQEMQEEIRFSGRVVKMLAPRGEDGRFPWDAYTKWAGAFWTLLSLVELRYPPGDTGLAPLRDQVLEWLLSEQHLKNIRLIDGRWRRCALQEASAVLAMLQLGIVDDRITRLVESLLKWQWPDGGWNCDKHPAAIHSSFHETWIPLLALKAYADASGSPRVYEAVERASEVFLSHQLYKRKSDGAVMDEQFTRLAYPAYWHYDILAGLRVVAAVGRITDPRCAAALDLLESKRLPDGGFAADVKYYKVVDVVRKGSGFSLVDWGGTSQRTMNEFVTLHALAVLKKAGRSI